MITTIVGTTIPRRTVLPNAVATSGRCQTWTIPSRDRRILRRSVIANGVRLMRMSVRYGSTAARST